MEKLYRSHVLVCAGAGCVSSGCHAVAEALTREIAKNKLENEIRVIQTGCVGSCDLGPVIVVAPEGTFYQKLKAEDAVRIVEEHLLKGRVVEDLVHKNGQGDGVGGTIEDIPFFKLQKKLVLRNCGVIDPSNIDEYIARDGYAALGKVLTEMTPAQVIEEIKKSGLRGRGGGGFPTGLKWQFAADAKGEQKYILCNADEGDPGAFMDRSLLEGDPHSVIEGMIIGAIAVGAHKGYIYVRDEYPLAVKNLKTAIDAARDKGLLGDNILGSGFSFDLKISRSGGAFVCGESSALMRSVEGNVGEPRAKYIRSVEKGLYDEPTVLNNVETWANVPEIMVKGADWYASLGTKGSKGTKVFSLVGKVNNTGLVEVPMGISVRELVEKIGGGILGGKKFKAVQTGGPSGGCIPERLSDLPVDFDSLTEAGSMMGSGGIIVMDEETCMVDVAKYFTNFLVGESCGKCTPCRDGLPRMLDILTGITEGKGTEEDIAALEELCEVISWGALCGLGTSAPNPVLSTIKYFREEYDAHIKDKKCPAGVCKALISYAIDAAACTGCTLCAKKCPQECITGERKKAHVIDATRCIKCGVCKDVCNFNAVRIS